MATALADGLWRLDLGAVNAYLYDDGEVVLVDAGTPWDADAVRAGVADAGYDLVDVDRVLVTHYDLDHVGGLAGLTPALDCPVYAHDPDASMLAGETRPPWRSLKGAFQRVTSALFVTWPALDVERVTDGADLGGTTAHHTPGHTPGHLAFVHRGLDVGFLGDLVRESDGDLALSPWYLSADVDAVRESVGSLAREATPFEWACVGHGEPLRRGHERVSALA
ncbi:MAG: MBL fold metallo-hydrolase [Halobacteriaceae archaeon]